MSDETALRPAAIRHHTDCPHSGIVDRRDAGCACRSALLAIDTAHLVRQREWSERTFGPGPRTLSITAHIRKELQEIEDDPTDLVEWIDVVILGLDGAWRTGATPEQILAALKAKQARNEARTWPDWRLFGETEPVEHLDEDPASL